MSLVEAPVVKTQMLIRRPVRQVFEAFVDPAITTKFWFTRSSGRLEPGAEVRWDWEMFGASAQVQVTAVEVDKRLLITWNGPGPQVEWTFQARPDDTTLVMIANSGFSREEGAVAQALDSMGGFTFLLSGAKAFLEHGMALNLVADHHPDAVRPAG
jgi:uncharacterized protein YndB with AHSA1/START domain